MRRSSARKPARAAAGSGDPEGGDYTIEVGASSRDLRASATVHVEGDALSLPLSLNSSIAEMMAHPIAGPVVAQAMAGMRERVGGDAAGASMVPNEAALNKLMAAFPIGRLVAFPGVPVSLEELEGLIAMANAGAPPTA